VGQWVSGIFNVSPGGDQLVPFVCLSDSQLICHRFSSFECYILLIFQGHCMLEMPSGTGKTISLLSLIISYMKV